jgi:methylglyoxal synthase
MDKKGPTASVPMNARKRIALIAHDHRKSDLLEWARYNRDELEKHELFGTGTTGAMIAEDLGLEVERFKSGPLGGDQQIGARISEGGIDLVIFFWDPMQPQPHDVDVKALLRIATVYNIPMATNRSSADFIISSPLMTEPYERTLVDYSKRIRG